MTSQTPGAGSPPHSAAPIQNRAHQLADMIEAIETMDLTDLRALWTRHFGTPPVLRSIPLMRLQLGWRLQARTYGGIDANMRRKLKQKSAVTREEFALAPGARLTREWQGRNYEIDVCDDGFRWNGKTYASLSAVALAITGTRWNGPRFFGLRKAP